MTGADITASRATLARLWGLPRPLTAAQLGRILQIERRDPGATVRLWETGRHPVPGPVQVALALMLAGARPEGAPAPETAAAPPHTAAPASGRPDPVREAGRRARPAAAAGGSGAPACDPQGSARRTGGFDQRVPLQRARAYAAGPLSGVKAPDRARPV